MNKFKLTIRELLKYDYLFYFDFLINNYKTSK